MGYYIDLVFDPNEQYRYKTLVKKFCSAGARKHLNPPEEPHLAELFYEGLLIDLEEDEAAIKKGFWADIRLSWATEPDRFREIIKVILELAQKVECGVYDGQRKSYVTFDNLDTVTVGFVKDAKWAIGLIDKIDTDK